MFISYYIQFFVPVQTRGILTRMLRVVCIPPPLSPLQPQTLKTIRLFPREIDGGESMYAYIWINLRVYKQFYIFLGSNVNKMKRFILY